MLRDRAWLVTTTDKAALKGVVDSSEAIGIIIGQPYGLDEVVVAVHQAVDTACAGRRGDLTRATTHRNWLTACGVTESDNRLNVMCPIMGLATRQPTAAMKEAATTE